jgi:hypothetical protein
MTRASFERFPRTDWPERTPLGGYGILNQYFSLDSEVKDLKGVVLFLSQQVAYRDSNFGEVGFLQDNLLILKDIELLDWSNIGIEA